MAILAFALPVLFGGPPYVPTLRLNLDAALDLLELKPGQTLLDLGSGDGRVLIAAAKRGWKGVGIEVSPFLVIISRIRTWKYRKQIQIIWGNYFLTKWPEADGVFGFIIQYQMRRLDKRIEEWHTKPVRVASFAFQIPDKTPIDQEGGVYLYEYK
ncbi:MAG TPA: class I SAM-dependent methyltransferase [Patescibacteria group bacterium]|nr:class I SAM-dependent methyltransferase [Patescibacteria group bacterium]